MSETQRKPVNRNFQRFICVGHVLSEPELKFMRPREGEEQGTAHCMFMASTGSPYGDNSDAVFQVQFKGKQAEMFCKEPRKGHKFLFDLQLKTFNVEKEGQRYPDRRTMFVGGFSFIEPRQKEETVAQSAPQQEPASAPTTQKLDEDVPF